jgi:peptidyl-prolyl cis-trans isomerase SurA
MQQQVKAQIAWLKIKSKVIKPRVNVSDDEIDDFVKAQMMNLSQEEFHVMEIVLPVEDPKDEQKTADLANKLAEELQSGKDFGNIAKQFSQSASALSGGDVGWLAESQLPKEMLGEIRRIGTNVISKPIRSIEGYFIIKVLESRKINSNDDQSLILLKQFSSQNVQNVLALNNPGKACIEPDSYAAKNGVSYKDHGILKIRDLGPELSSIVSRLEAGKFSPPLNIGGASVLIVCEKTEDISGEVDQTKRDRAKDILFDRKMELAARKYLRDLRRTTNIEVKI